MKKHTFLALVGTAVLPLSLFSIPALAQVTPGELPPATPQNINAETAVTRQPDRAFEARLQTDRTQYRRNQAVEITLTLTNLESSTRRVIPIGKPQYNFRVREARSNKTVFLLSKNRSRLPDETFWMEGGTTRTYREIWDFTDDNGRRVEPGVYIIEANIYPQNTVSTQVYLSDRSAGGGIPYPPPDSPRPRRGLIASVFADKRRARPGDTVSVLYTVRNNSRDTMVLRFPSGRKHDMTVTGPDGKVVWKQSEGQFYTQALTAITFEPGEQQTFRGSWTIHRDAQPGRYSVYSFLTPSSQAEGAFAPAATTVIVGNETVPNPDNPTEGGRPGGIPGGMPFPGPIVVARPTQVSLRILMSPAGSRYVGQQVTLIGRFSGRTGGSGAPPVNRNDWVLVADGLSIYVSGKLPSASEGRTVVVTGTVRRTTDNRLYLDAS